MRLEKIPYFILITGLWAVLVAIIAWVRPLYYSTEEMHYASIAWEMWFSHHFILPVQGGQFYPEKGPLLFWLIHIGWYFFGVSSWWVRLMPALFGLGLLFLLKNLVLQLWPEEKTIAKLAPVILLTSFFFTAKLPVARLDIITAFFSLMAIYYLILSVEKGRYNWLIFAISLALGLLAKGPVVFLFIIPAMLTVKYWSTPAYPLPSLYSRMIFAFLLSIALAACWLIPALLQGGPDYAYMLLFSRSVGRIWSNHQYWQQNWFFYLYNLPMMLLPWVLWLPFWQALKAFIKDARQHGLDKKIKLLLILITSSLIFLTFVNQKAPRYILPALPFAIILLSYIFVKYIQKTQKRDQLIIAFCYLIVGLGYSILTLWTPTGMLVKYPWLAHISPLWGVGIISLAVFWFLWNEKNMQFVIKSLAISTVIFWTCYNLGVTRAQAGFGDWRMLGQQIAQLQRNGAAVAYAGGSEQVLEFFGRLQKPLISLRKEEIPLWVQNNPNGWLVVKDYEISPMQLHLVSAESVK